VEPHLRKCGRVGNIGTAVGYDQNVNIITGFGVSATGAATTEDLVARLGGDNEHRSGAEGCPR
jgi:hypothetical protein